jgi:hypothetical protein
MGSGQQRTVWFCNGSKHFVLVYGCQQGPVSCSEYIGTRNSIEAVTKMEKGTDLKGSLVEIMLFDCYCL